MGAAGERGGNGGGEFPSVGREEQVDCRTGQGELVQEVGVYEVADWGGAVC